MTASNNIRLPITSWLPASRDEIAKRGWDQADVIIVSGDAYIDHPAFGPPLIARIIESAGLRVAMLPQPNWRDDLRDFKKLGIPRLFFGVSAGNMDSMVNHYTAAKRLRSDDVYTPGGKSGFRPDNASVVYTHILKKLYPDIPVVLGGVEASMRRFTYFDYWADCVKPSVLIESGADMLIYGMAEKSMLQLCRLLMEGRSFNNILNLPQSVVLVKNEHQLPESPPTGDLWLPSHRELLSDKKLFAETFRIWETEINRTHPRRLLQQNEEGILVINPPQPLLTTQELDAIYDLPFTRLPHPRYQKRGAIPAFKMIQNSITIHRGCFGGCSFCTLAAHQGKFIVSRSEDSIIKEAKRIARMPSFKGHITDLGGPSANMFEMTPLDPVKCQKCSRPSCIHPSICKNLNSCHLPLIRLYGKVRRLPGVKRVTIGSGIRYDLFMHTNDPKEAASKGHNLYLKELVLHHVSGRLKVAPEHTSPHVLKLMRKPPFALFAKLKQQFDLICRNHQLNYQLVPYFISSHPGSRKSDMDDLASETKQLGFKLEQVQDFTPTPLTLATTMFYTGLDPYTMQPVYVARSYEEKQQQKARFFWYKPSARPNRVSGAVRKRPYNQPPPKKK